MKRIYFFCSLLLSLLLTSCGDYDDSAIQNKLNDFKERITALQTKANKLNEDISKLSYLTEGNVITSVTRNSDGQYVITYKDSNNEEKAVVVATQECREKNPSLRLYPRNGGKRRRLLDSQR